MATTPKKAKKSEAKTAQTGLMPETDYIGKQYITPKKLPPGEEDYDEENVESVVIDEPTAEEAQIMSRQQEFDAALRKAAKTSKGGKKKRRSTKKTKKVKKIKKHRKQK